MIRFLVLTCLAFLFWCVCFVAFAGPLDETRYCGALARNADGSIMRSQAVLAAFQRIHPCPSTGLATGPCPGWSKDHVMPLADGFCDSVQNLQWLPNVLKSGPGKYPKDRWEIKINRQRIEIVQMPASGVLTVEQR